MNFIKLETYVIKTVVIPSVAALATKEDACLLYQQNAKKYFSDNYLSSKAMENARNSVKRPSAGPKIGLVAYR